MFPDCCNFKGGAIHCMNCQECCAACAETCNCCGTTSIESCFDACCPKRGVCLKNSNKSISFFKFIYK